MKLLEPKCYIKQVGATDIDNCYMVEQEILLDDGGHMFACVQVDEEFVARYCVTEKSLTDPTLKASEIKVYKKKKNASKYWPEVDFDALDHRMEQLFDDFVESLDDTALHGGARGGTNITNEGMTHYVEYALYNEIDDKNIYLQVIQNNGVNHYSVTDTSIYMRINLGPQYDGFFKTKKDVVYLFDGDDLDTLGDYDYLKGAFEELVVQLNQHVNDVKMNSMN